MSPHLYSAEFVFPGHPDKLSDAIADAVVLEASRRERRALVGVEVAVHRRHVFITGRIGCENADSIDIEALVREVYRSAGYDADWYPSPDEVHVETDLCLGPLEEGEAEFRELADDQAICIGYANDLVPTGHLPVEHWLAQRLARRLYHLRAEQPDLALGPDGKVIVAVREADATWALDTFSCSLQQRADADAVGLHRAVRVAIEEEMQQLSVLLPGLAAALPERLAVNGAGAFEVGGPEGDNGLSGKKLVMDAYGPRVPIGGGAWSGKDFFKADRAGALHARRIAKFIVQLGLAREAQVNLLWTPGAREARIVAIQTPAGSAVKRDAIAASVDCSLGTSGMEFPIADLVEAARWGHFTHPGYPWERSAKL